MSDLSDTVEDVSEIAEGVLSLGKKKILSFAGIIGGVFGFVADVLQPIAPFATYLLAGSAILLVCNFIYYLKAKKGLVMALVLLFITIILGSVTILQKVTAADESGVASKVIPGISDLQTSLGLLQQTADQIKQDTSELKEQVANNTAIAQEHLEISKNNAETNHAINQKIDSLPGGGIKNTPESPEDYYHNAKIYELNGDYGNARKSYKAYITFKTKKLDPHLRLITFLRANEGRAGALEEYGIVTRGIDSLAVQYTKILLLPAEARQLALIEFQQAHPDFAPVYYHLSREYSKEKLGQQSFSAKRHEYLWMVKFTELHKQGALASYFANKELLSEWHDDITARLKLAESYLEQLNHPVSVAWQSHNGGMMGNLTILEPVLDIEVKKAGEKEFTHLGHQTHTDMNTGKPSPNATIQLGLHELTPSTFAVRYRDISGAMSDIYHVKLEEHNVKSSGADEKGNIVIDQQTLNICKMTANQWLSFRYYNDEMLLYFTSVLAYRGILEKIEYGLNTETPNTAWEFAHYDGKWPAPTAIESPDDLKKLMLKVPTSTAFATIQLTYKDGTKSKIIKIVNQDVQ